MVTAYFTLIIALVISVVAEYFSILGLTAIFSTAFWPVVIMGSSLALGKIAATLWLKQNWKIAPFILKIYLLLAITILMFITALGSFGFMSKAHSDQNLVSGDVQARIEIYDQKIQTSRENIEANRRALTQLDAAVNETLGRSTDEAGASRAVRVRRSQQTERAQILQEIEEEQTAITELNEEAAPIRAQSREVEAKVGPIKYIAQLIYGDNPDANLLEKAVSWMIIMIVVVFDPLALALLLASQYSFQQLRKKKEEPEDAFVETFLESKGTVDPDIALGFDEPTVPDETFKDVSENIISKIKETLEEDKSKVVEEDVGEVFEQIEERIIEDDPVIDPERELPPVKITHTPQGMTVEDSAGIQEISTSPSVTVLNKEYLMVDGQTIHHNALDSESASADDAARSLISNTYVQNEEQGESSQWSSILRQQNITESEYLEAARKRHNEQ